MIEKKNKKTNKFNLIFVLAALSAPINIFANELTCAQKQKAIETEIAYAKVYNNPYKINRLNRALSNVKRYCSDADLEVKRDERIKEKELKAAKAKRELQEAQLKGDSSKILKKEQKLNKALAELAEAKSAQ